jgi:hypothetical protein
VPSFHPVFAHFSPETLLSVTSIIATVAGLCLMFGRNTLRLIARWVDPSRSQKQAKHHLEGPHFRRSGRKTGEAQKRAGE